MVQWDTLLPENKTKHRFLRFTFWTRTTEKTETLATLFSIGQARLPLTYSCYSSPFILIQCF